MNSPNKSGSAEKNPRTTARRALGAIVAAGALTVAGVNILGDSGDKAPVLTTTTTEASPKTTTTILPTSEASIVQDNLVLTQPTPVSPESTSSSSVPTSEASIVQDNLVLTQPTQPNNE